MDDKQPELPAAAAGAEPWRRRQGLLFRVVAWVILLLIALSILTMVVLWMGNVGQPAPLAGR